MQEAGGRRLLLKACELFASAPAYPATGPRGADVEQIVTELAGMLVPEVATGCAVDLLDEGGGESKRVLERNLGPGERITVPIAAHGRVLGELTVQAAPGLAESTLGPELRAVASIAAAAIEHTRHVRARDEMLSVVSHDLRNPLNVVTVASASLRQGIVPAEKVGSYCDKMKRAADRMNRLIQDLVDCSRMEAGRIRFERAPVEVSELVEAACQRVQARAEERKVQVVREVEPQLPRVRVDLEQTARAVGNVLANAVQFSAPGAQVVLAASASSEGVELIIRDHGVGIPPEELPRVFDRYFQGRGAERQGVGLGLALTRRILSAHDGRARVESTPGAGTTVSVLLPADDASGRLRR